MGEPFRMLIKAYTPGWTEQKISPSQQEFDFLERRILDGESLDDEEVDRYVDLLEKVTGVYTWKRIHGNSKKSTKPQIIYRIYVVDTDETLKYGISGDGESRPKEQLKELKERFGVEVDFKIVDRAPNNDEARQKEQKLVDDFFEREGLKPRAQKLPKSKYE
ncbi:hypothetical protein [Lunatibacter salilacus]|uniref:hypothetical protein n=1 Tax=Lunatibacter salilacus TaxID=2483804 RepID=UPI00293B9D31|nr:hypothetical protein [Lunatibacter salilacus]